MELGKVNGQTVILETGDIEDEVYIRVDDAVIFWLKKMWPGNYLVCPVNSLGSKLKVKTKINDDLVTLDNIFQRVEEYLVALEDEKVEIVARKLAIYNSVDPDRIECEISDEGDIDDAGFYVPDVLQRPGWAAWEKEARYLVRSLNL